MIRSTWAIALAASGGLAGGVHARDVRYRIDIPAGDLTDALATLSAQTGVSIGTDVHPGGIRSAAVRGRHDVGAALSTMLARTPFEARMIGPRVWRLVPRRRDDHAQPPPPPLPDIVVTTRKLPETLSQVATPVAVYVPPSGAGRSGAGSIHDVANAVEGLSVTGLGPGRDRPFIRGIADSPFNGFSQAAVSINVDDARVTYDAPEPGLRLVDVARVEVLKGPQGPLYGTGALGGVYRVVTNRPVPGSIDGEVASSLSITAKGGPGAEASAMVNLPLFGERAAVRVVGYVGSQGGWIRDASRSGAVNDSDVDGARVALRVVPAAGWTVDVGGMHQRIATRDSQYVDRDEDDFTRSPRLPEPSSSAFELLAGTLVGPVGSAQLTVTSSHAWQDRSETYDVTPLAGVLGNPAARRYQDQRRHRVFDQEMRLTSAQGRRFAWTAGASYLSATTYATGTLRDAGGGWLPFAFLLHRAISEAAVFADGSIDLAPRLRVGVGARLFRASTDDERSEDLGNAATARASTGVTPSGSLIYALAPDRSVYVRFGTAFRPGGIDPTNATTGRYDADEVRSVDLGTRLLLDDGRLSVSGGGFRSSWSYVQSDYLLANGLIATRNAGDAIILGIEGSAEWRRGGWSVHAGATVQRARLETTADGADRPTDARLPIVPDVAGRFEVARAIRVANMPGSVTLGATYTGAARLSFDEGLDRRMGGYALVRSAATTTIGGVEVRIGLENLLNARADAFAFGNPFRIRIERQYTPLQPRTVTLSVSRRF